MVQDDLMSTDLTSFDEALRGVVDRWSLEVDGQSLARMGRHFELLLDANQVMNLTRIIDPVEAAIKHYGDSLALVRWACDGDVAVRTVLDIGTGAGFPAVPLALARPDWSVTAIDGTAKKIRFVRSVTEQLNIENLTATHAHSAHWETVDRFDLVVFRALATLPKSLALAARLVTPGGWLVAYRTMNAAAGDANETEQPHALHGLRQVESYPYDLECGSQTLHRVLSVFRRATRP